MSAAEFIAEQRQWIADFREGMFHVHCHKCGTGEPYLPPEFFGLIESLAEACDRLEAVPATASEE